MFETRSSIEHHRSTSRLSPPISFDSFDETLFCEKLATKRFSGTVYTSDARISGCHSGAGPGWVLDHVLWKLSCLSLPGERHAELYLRHLYRRNCRSSTIHSSSKAIELFLTFLKEAEKSSLEEITREDIGAFIEHEQDRGLKPASVRTRLNAVYAFMRFLIEGGIVRSEVLVRKLRIKQPDLLPRAIDSEDVKRLLAVIDGIRDRAMILLLLRSGMRIGELLSVKVNDISLREQKIVIYQADKTQVGRVVYFSDDAREALEAWLEGRDSHKEFLFYGQGRERLTYTGARLRFTRYLQKAGLSDKGYTVHCLRHTFATELLNAGLRLECLQQLLGHSNLEVTRRYARLSDNTREEEYFKAMSIIERNEKDDRHQLDGELAALLEEEELLAAHR